MHIILGSMSTIKTDAVEAACHALGLTVTITTTPVDSGISAQPVGRAETERGARNRARGAQAHAPGSFAIGIENGIRETANGYEDWAVIAVVCPDGTEVLTDGPALPLPTESVEEARARGFATATVGQILAEHFGSNPNDPHSFLTHGSTSRLSLLTEAAKTALLHLGTH